MHVVRIITRGCAKNDVDSEEIAGVLLKNGFRVDASADYSDFAIINTWGFLEAAECEGLKVSRSQTQAPACRIVRHADAASGRRTCSRRLTPNARTPYSRRSDRLPGDQHR
ncbi:MAG: hypothetical protein C4341_08855 [Armatimonadota bacterium]